MKKSVLAVCIGVMAASAGAEGASCPGNGGLRDFGCAYYPEAWPEERWETDLSMMEELGMNLIRIGEFNWSRFEPREGEFDFAPYLRLLDLCEKHGIKAMMCTPTAAPPAWMAKRYPETQKLRADGSRPAWGGRQTACLVSPKYREFSRRIVERMAEAFRDHPAVTTWQLDNEIAIWGRAGSCVCDACRAAWIADLKRRYGTVENLNKEFNGVFWSMGISDWEDIHLPVHETRFGPGRDYARFHGEQDLRRILEQADILRKANPKWRITSNNPSASQFTRMDRLFANLGYAATDTYISNLKGAGYEAHLWIWSMYRGLTGTQKPFMVAETGAFNWDEAPVNSYDAVKPWFYLALMHGAESYLYFRWRESVSGEETHPAILPWSGRKTFVFDRLKRQMEEYRSLPEPLARLPLPAGEVAIVHDAESHSYELFNACKKNHGDWLEDSERNLLYALERRGVRADLVQLSSKEDWSKYPVAFFCCHDSLDAESIARIRAYVEKGGHAVAVGRMNFASPLGGYYLPEPTPAGMLDLFGLEVLERRDGGRNGSREYADVSRGAEVLERYTDFCFKGAPLLTRHAYGKGAAYYQMKTPLEKDEARHLVDVVLSREGVAMRPELPEKVYRGERGPYTVIINMNETPVELPAEPGKPLIGSPRISGDRMTVEGFGVLIFGKE